MSESLVAAAIQESPRPNTGAMELRLPCFLYVKESALVERDSEPDKRERLTRLKQDMRRHGATTFHGPADLAEKLTADLHRWVFESYLTGLTALGTDTSSRIHNFLAEYLGTLKEPVPFGGRDDELARLDAWLEDLKAQPYLLFGAPAGRGEIGPPGALDERPGLCAPHLGSPDRSAFAFAPIWRGRPFPR